MKYFVRSHNSGGRLKVFLRRSSAKFWHELFNNEINNLILKHPFIDQFIWIKPKCEKEIDENDEECMNLFNQSKYYLFEKVYPSSMLSIQFIQNTMIENSAFFISSPNTFVESNCTFSLFPKQIKYIKNFNLHELVAIIRTPNSLYSNVLNIDKFINMPPHMKKSCDTSFFKIELSDKSYWNDKQNFISNYYLTDFSSQSVFSPLIDDEIKIDKNNGFFINPITDPFKNPINNVNFESNKESFVEKTTNSHIYKCIGCRINKIDNVKFCYCNSLLISQNAPCRNSYNFLSYKTRGQGNNPFYHSIKRQFGPNYFTEIDFLGYFDRDEINQENEISLIEKLKAILQLNGSSRTKITPIYVKVSKESVNKSLLLKKKSNSRILKISSEFEISTCEPFAQLQFIDLKTLKSHLFETNSKSLKTVLSRSLVFEQIMEYFDILSNQNLFSEDEILVKPLDSWNFRYDYLSCENLDEPAIFIKEVSDKEAPNCIFKVNGMLKPTLINQYIWFIANQVATGNYPWSLIYLRGISTSPLSFNYKPHFNDDNSTNSVNDLYLLIFKQNEELFLICIRVVNEKDANV